MAMVLETAKGKLEGKVEGWIGKEFFLFFRAFLRTWPLQNELVTIQGLPLISRSSRIMLQKLDPTEGLSTTQDATLQATPLAQHRVASHTIRLGKVRDRECMGVCGWKPLEPSHSAADSSTHASQGRTKYGMKSRMAANQHWTLYVHLACMHV